MNAPRIVVVVNPRAANGRAGRLWPELRPGVAERLGGTLTDRFTEAPGDATRVTREALRDGADVVIALGGDGSANEAANGFFEPPEPGGDDLRPIRPDAALGVLPLGTGGDFRKSLRLPGKTLAAAEAIGRALRRAEPLPRIDVGLATVTRADGAGRQARVFVNIASCGQSGVVTSHANRMSKALGGGLTFGLATLRAFAGWRNQPVTLSADGEPPRDYIINTVAVGNGRFFGGGMMVCPGARLDDGTFDVTVLGDLGVLDYLFRGLKLYDGRVAAIPGVTCFRARKVELAPAGGDGRPVLVEMEGENVGRLPATFTLHRAVLSVAAELGSRGAP